VGDLLDDVRHSIRCVQNDQSLGLAHRRLVRVNTEGFADQSERKRRGRL
jgi:hypothetical protein